MPDFLAIDLTGRDEEALLFAQVYLTTRPDVREGLLGFCHGFRLLILSSEPGSAHAFGPLQVAVGDCMTLMTIVPGPLFLREK